MSSASSVLSDSEKIASIREQFPVLKRFVYLNTGTNGPLPSTSAQVMQDYFQSELENGRITMDAFGRMLGERDKARELLASLLGCDASEVALTHNTTEGMNIALLGIDWQPGDEIITANSEHEGGLNPVALLKERYGVTVHYTNIGLRDCDTLAELERYLSPKTKAVVLSHVSWASGMILPMREISERAHQVGAVVICDAAQSFGMIPVSVYDLGVDAYACSGQKWLCGPDGTGALFIRSDRLDFFKQSFMAYFSLKNRMVSNDVPFEVTEGARRHEAVTISPATVAGLNAGLEWIAKEVGWEWAFERIRKLNAYAHKRLSQVEGVQIYLNEPSGSGLLHFALEGMPPAELTEALTTKGILIRHTPLPLLNRVATGFYNTEEDIDRLAEAIGEIYASRLNERAQDA